MIIGIGGNKGSGKDTISDILVRQYKVKKIALADPLKELLAKHTYIPLADFYDPKKKDELFNIPFEFLPHEILNLTEDLICNMSPRDICNFDLDEVDKALFNLSAISIRDLLQKFGTNICRKLIDPDIWLKINKKRIEELTGDIVICDLRFPNERQMVRDIGGTLIKVKRPIINNDSHESENQIGDDSEYDIIINNDEDLAKLDSEVGVWFSIFRKMR